LNFALPAIAVILAVIPGVAFLVGYVSEQFPRKAFALSPVSELAVYLALAVPIDALAIGLGITFHVPLPDLSLVERVFVGEWSDSSLWMLHQDLSSCGFASLTYYVFVVIVSGFAGWGAQRYVWAHRLDVRWPILRMRHDWHNNLMGRLPNQPADLVPYADVLATHPSEGDRLYSGIVSRFEVNNDGSLRVLILEDAQRGKGRGVMFEWKPIKPSNGFAILGTTIISINFRYVALEDPPASVPSEQ